VLSRNQIIEPLIVVFCSAEKRSFAEQKTTIGSNPDALTFQ
jgi:hypothetical protein